MVIPDWLTAKLKAAAPDGVNIGTHICTNLSALARNWERHGEIRTSAHYALGDNLPNRIADRREPPRDVTQRIGRAGDVRLYRLG